MFYFFTLMKRKQRHCLFWHEISLFVSLSWSQDKTHDPCRQEVGTAQSNQWRQQRNVKQLHTGADGSALPPESVQMRARAHTRLLWLFTYSESHSVCDGVFSSQLLMNRSFHRFRGIIQWVTSLLLNLKKKKNQVILFISFVFTFCSGRL